MNASNAPALRYAKGIPAVLLKKARQNAQDKEWHRCCKRVDERDKRRCWVTGRTLTAGSMDPWQALERHHIRPRSVDPGKRANANNIVTISRAMHKLVHAGLVKLLDKHGHQAKTFSALAYALWVGEGPPPFKARALVGRAA
jgi:hypothetical protein